MRAVGFLRPVQVPDRLHLRSVCVCDTVHIAGNRGENITVFDAAEPSSAVELLNNEGLNEKVRVDSCRLQAVLAM